MKKLIKSLGVEWQLNNLKKERKKERKVFGEYAQLFFFLILLRWVLVAACENFSCGMGTL